MVLERSALEQMGETGIGTILVKYRYVEGYHVFTSPDVRGLYVASKDAREAYDSVGPVLQRLVQIKLKAPFAIEPARDFDEFMKLVQAPADPRLPQVLKDRQYVIRREAA